MATLDRIDPRYTPWTPSSAGMVTEPELVVDAYRGRHRRSDEKRRPWLMSLFYRAKHAAS